MQEYYLTDIEKKSLEKFNEDAIMSSAVKKVLLSEIYYSGTLQSGGKIDPKKNFTLGIADQLGLSDEKIGNYLRAALIAVQLVERGYETLEKFRKGGSSAPQPNPGR